MTAARARGVALLILLAGLVLAFAMAPKLARAHPLGNFTINRYARIDVYSQVLRLAYVLDYAEIPTFQMQPDLDADGNGTVSAAEADDFARRNAEGFAAAIDIRLNGQRLRFAAEASHGELLPGQAGLQTLRLAFSYDAHVTDTGSATVTFADHNFEDRAGWKEFVVRPSAGARVTVDPRLSIDTSDELRSYPAVSLQSAPNVREASFTWEAGTGEAAPAASLAPAGDRRETGAFTGVFEDLLGDQSFGFVLVSLLLAILFGAQHALGPGHGKAMVGAYLVGTRGTARHAVVLGLTVTATHTSSVYLLGAITLLAANYFTPESVYLYMGIASGALVIAFGAVLLGARTLRLRPRNGAEHRHGLLGRPHAHAAPEHNPPHQQVAEAPGMRGLLSLGILGGLLPCPSAVVVMVAAIAQGEVALGMLLITAFSLGLAAVLTAIGLSLVVARRFPIGNGRFARLAGAPLALQAVRLLPLVSAFAVTAAGVFITWQAASQPGV